MTRRILLIVIVTLVFAALVFPQVASAMPDTKSLGGPDKITSKNLPIKKLPAGFLNSFSKSAGNPECNPSCQGKKPPQPRETNKWAVVIGISNYQGGEYDLWNPDKDAKEMYKALTENYGFSKDHIQLLVNNKAAFTDILSAIDWLCQNEDGDSTVVFFYSGHGAQALDSVGYDADIEPDGYDEGIVSYDFYGLPDGILTQLFSGLESKKVAFCFGSCNSGGMFDDPDSDLQGPGRVIVSACAADQLAWDYRELHNTLWGKYFVDEGLLQGLPGSVGRVSIEKAQDYAKAKVAAQPDSTPQIYDGFARELIP